MSLARGFLVIGGLAALLAVLAGAFGAHALGPTLEPGAMATFRTAVDYHFYHALGLLLVGSLGLHWPGSRGLGLAGALLLAGMVLFSGSLYLLVLTGERMWGAVTPFGGTAFVLGWLALAVTAARQR